MEIDEALEEFDFFNEGDYITREMATAKEIVLKKLQETESDLYEANNRIADLLLVLGDRDRVIDKMANDIYWSQIECNRYFKDKEDVIKTFEERCKDAND